MGGGHRQPPGAGPHRHPGHHLGQGPADLRARPGIVPADRRRHQPRQFRRPPAQSQGRDHRHQHCDPPGRAEHRLRGAGGQDQPGAQGPAQRQAGEPRLPGRGHQGPGQRIPGLPGHPGRRGGLGRGARRPRRQGRHQAAGRDHRGGRGPDRQRRGPGGRHLQPPGRGHGQGHRVPGRQVQGPQGRPGRPGKDDEGAGRAGPGRGRKSPERRPGGQGPEPGAGLRLHGGGPDPGQPAPVRHQRRLEGGRGDLGGLALGGPGEAPWGPGTSRTSRISTRR